MTITDQYKSVRAQVDSVCKRCGRDPESVMLVAVSKTVEAACVQDAIDGGATDFGENRPDHILPKSALYPQVKWHFIGNVQSRRIPDIVSCSCLVHSVFKPEHLPKFDSAAAALGKVQDILLEVNVSGEQSKGGIAPADAPAFLRQAATLEHVRVRGLMTMAPLGSQDVARSCFAKLRQLRDELRAQGVCSEDVLSELSMGMTDDWPCAIEEGATIIRVGRAIFSESFA